MLQSPTWSSVAAVAAAAAAAALANVITIDVASTDHYLALK